MTDKTPSKQQSIEQRAEKIINATESEEKQDD